MKTQELDVPEQKHEERGNCFCEVCHHKRMEWIQKERKQLQVNRYILQNTSYGHIHYLHHVTMERTSELRIQPATAIRVKMNVNEVQITTVDDAKGQDINEVKLVDTTPPWDSQEMLTISKQKPCKNGTKLSQMKKDMRNKTVYITKEPQTVLYTKELNQNGHSKNICRNKLFSSSLKKEPPESQTLGHFWDKNWMPLIKNEFCFII